MLESFGDEDVSDVKETLTSGNLFGKRQNRRHDLIITIFPFFDQLNKYF